MVYSVLCSEFRHEKNEQQENVQCLRLLCLLCLLRSQLKGTDEREGFFPSMVGTEEFRRASGSRLTGVPVIGPAWDSLALSTLHP